MNVYEAAAKRRSIRRFQNKAVPMAVLEKCIDAGRLAPCGRNQQLCDFIAINEAGVLPGVFEHIGGSVKAAPDKGGPRPGQEPKAYTILLINKTKEGDMNRRRVTLMDAGMAAENVILEAWEQGLGCCPILMFNEKDLKLILNVPEEYDVALVIAMGYPDEAPATETAGTRDLMPAVDAKGVRHVPKRALKDVIHKNKF